MYISSPELTMMSTNNFAAYPSYKLDSFSVAAGMKPYYARDFNNAWDTGNSATPSMEALEKHELENQLTA